MGSKTKIISGCIILILVISSLFIIFYNGNNNPCKDPIIIDDNKGNTKNDNQNQDDNNRDIGFTHTVFIEEASDTGCIPCTKVAEILNELYLTGDYNFYYVSLVEDKSSVAQKRIKEDLNVIGYPVVLIDGGYKILLGGNVPKSDFTRDIRSAELRNVPKLKLNVTSEYDENSTDLITKVFVENFEDEIYKGTIKIYLTEIISRWNQANSEPYHFALVDFIINKDIEIPANGNVTLEDKTKISDFEVSSLKPEELLVIGVIFSSDSVKKDSFPLDEDQGEFDAHYADATTATYVVPGGNLPPQAKIIYPEVGKLHILGKALFSLPLKNTVLTGSTFVRAEVKDDSDITKVEFYIDGTLIYTDEEAPYEYEIKKPLILGRITFKPKHEIKIIAYDSEGKTDDATLNVITLFRIKN